MGLNISLFVHGVPMGQKMWGPKGDDLRYLSTFYGPKWESPEVMKVEVMTFGGVTNCYYSFVKGQNVCDSQGRAGSYFALTLRINAFYVDVQNMYNILKAAYEKMCVGLCVQDTGAMIKYLVADFQSIDSKLKDIENHIVNYIGEFSINEDLVSLLGFSAISQGASLNVNLHECMKNVALDCLKKAGKIMVSPYFLSASSAKTVEKYKAEIDMVRQKARQEIQLQQRTSQEKIASMTQESQAKMLTVKQQAEEKLRLCEQRSQQQIAQANAENNRRMQELKQNYSAVDEKLDALNQRNKELENEVTDWKQQYKQKNKELLSSNVKIQKLQEFAEKLQRDVSSLKGNSINVFPTRYTPKKSVVDRNFIIVCIVGFFVILLVGFLVYLLMGNWGNKNGKIEDLQEKVERLEKENQQLQTENGQLKISQISNTEDGLKALTISIRKNGKEVDEVECGKTYVISIVGEDTDTLKGKFEGSAFNIDASRHLMPNRKYAGKTCIIRYVHNGHMLAQKSIKIKKD